MRQTVSHIMAFCERDLCNNVLVFFLHIVPLDPAPKNGLKVMPMFDPTKVKLKPAGPPTAPPPSADPRKPIKGNHLNHLKI